MTDYGTSTAEIPRDYLTGKDGASHDFAQAIYDSLDSQYLTQEPWASGDHNICHLPLLLWGFVSLQVPPATSDPLAFISFSAKGTAVDLAERRSVVIQNVDNSVFIQTDKPIYKPGQKGAEEFESVSELANWVQGWV